MYGNELRRGNGLPSVRDDFGRAVPVRRLGLFRRVQSNRRIGSLRHINAIGNDQKRVAREKQSVPGNK